MRPAQAQQQTTHSGAAVEQPVDLNRWFVIMEAHRRVIKASGSSEALLLAEPSELLFTEVFRETMVRESSFVNPMSASRQVAWNWLCGKTQLTTMSISTTLRLETTAVHFLPP